MSRFALFAVLALCVTAGTRAVAHEAPELDNPLRLLTQQELDRVNTLDVAKCWAVVTATVATVGRAAAVARHLGVLGQRIALIDNTIELTIAQWIRMAGVPGLTEAGAQGLGMLVVKAGEVMGLYTAGRLTKEAMVFLVRITLSAVTSCSKVVQVYYDGIVKLPQVFFPRETACGGNLQRYVACQRTCATSLDRNSKRLRYAAFIPRACAGSPLEERIIATISGAYQRNCLHIYCSGTPNLHYTNRTMTRFGQCGQRLDPAERAFLEEATTLCTKEREAVRFLGR